MAYKIIGRTRWAKVRKAADTRFYCLAVNLELQEAATNDYSCLQPRGKWFVRASLEIFVVSHLLTSMHILGKCREAVIWLLPLLHLASLYWQKLNDNPSGREFGGNVGPRLPALGNRGELRREQNWCWVDKRLSGIAGLLNSLHTFVY